MFFRFLFRIVPITSRTLLEKHKYPLGDTGSIVTRNAHIVLRRPPFKKSLVPHWSKISTQSLHIIILFLDREEE